MFRIVLLGLLLAPLAAPAQKTGTEAAAENPAEAQKAKGKEFADKVAKEPGAKRLPSGLVLRTIRPGSGAAPKVTDTVRVHYEGKFVDGKVFDSSYKRNIPAQFPLRGVIKCWTEALQKMRVGEKAQLVCPSDIAYGDNGRSSIPGGATLVFTVELLGIVAAQ
jgi:FKBP-type peptidyl-prolyl cis-trans isomerase FkpA